MIELKCSPRSGVAGQYFKGDDSSFLFSRTATIKEVLEGRDDFLLFQVRRVFAGVVYLPPHKCNLFLVEDEGKETPLDDISKVGLC